MPQKRQRPSASKFHIRFLTFFRSYPALPFILKWTVLSCIIGVCVGSVSAGFLQSLDWVTNFRESHIWIIALLPIGGFVIGLQYHYFGKRVESGNNLLIDTINQPEETIPFRMAPFVYLGTMVTHLLGGSAGREGTALQMAGAIADQFSKPFRLSQHDRRILIIAAVAAGFGSVFGTPFAGAIFGMEVFLIGRLRYNAIFPAFASAIIADVVTKYWHAHHTQYHIPIVPQMSALHLMYAIIAGIAFGLCAAAFSKTLHGTATFFTLKISFPPLRPFVGGLVVILAVFAVGTTKYIGLGIPSIVDAFGQQMPIYDFTLKMAFTVITLAAGFKGGEVTPLFFIGAALGSSLSILIPLPVGLLAGMGFVAVFAAATNTPLASSIMALELFGVECGVYAATACTVAYLCSGHNSIYGHQLVGEPKHSRFTNIIKRRMRDL